jgi:hypothetical protein
MTSAHVIEVSVEISIYRSVWFTSFVDDKAFEVMLGVLAYCTCTMVVMVGLVITCRNSRPITCSLLDVNFFGDVFGVG